MNYDYLLSQQKEQLYYQQLQQTQSGQYFDQHPTQDDSVYMDQDTSDTGLGPYHNPLQSPKFMHPSNPNDPSHQAAFQDNAAPNQFTSIDSLNFRPPNTFTQLNNNSNTNLLAASSSPPPQAYPPLPSPHPQSSPQPPQAFSQPSQPAQAFAQSSQLALSFPQSSQLALAFPQSSQLALAFPHSSPQPQTFPQSSPRAQQPFLQSSPRAQQSFPQSSPRAQEYAQAAPQPQQPFDQGNFAQPAAQHNYAQSSPQHSRHPIAPSVALDPPQPVAVESSAQSPNYVYFNRTPDLLSPETKVKTARIKLTLENYYQMLVTHAIERNTRRLELEKKLATEEANLSEERKNRQLALLGKKESLFLRLRRTKMLLEDFTTVKVIGKGAFGEVRLVQKNDSGKIYAMKTLLKREMVKRDQLAHVKAERDVLAGSDSPWVVSLYYSFQDLQYLYLIMEFLPGGDLMTMLIRWQVFTEDITRFYMAECVLAIEAIHKLGYIHRDIKPDNILIDVRGHIKLSDFGLSTGFHKTHDSNYYKKLLEKAGRHSQLAPNQLTSLQGEGGRNSVMVDAIHLTMLNRQQMQTWRKLRRLMAYLTVGTPDYIAPEIFVQQGYGQECDWWLLGAIMFECLIGWPPFCSETPHETYRKIMNWRETLQIPQDVHLLPEAEDLIRRLLLSSEDRIGRFEGAIELKRHPFFRGVDWNTIRHVDAPFIPKLRLMTDTRFFPTDDLENVPDAPMEHVQSNGTHGDAQGPAETKQNLPFIGYTYLRFDYLTRKNAL